MIQLHDSFAEEKKESDREMSPPTRPGGAPLLSPSKQRAMAAGSAGLSELSKQLRILQAKNEAQSVEINRLERQLRILAELQGISVADLRKALEDACANEAFGELQHRVAKLRAELEAATLAKQKEQSKSTAAPHIANLELRVGELEEVEERHQREIHHLYDQLGHEQSKATRLEAERDQHKHDAQEYLERLNKAMAKANHLEATFQDQLQKFQVEQARKMQEMAKMANEAAANSRNAKRSTPEVSPEEHELMTMLLKEKTGELRAAEERFNAEQERWMQQLRDKDAEVRAAQTRNQVELGKMNLKIKELQDTDSQSDLRLAQFKARFNVQDERINDMDQQLSSLYTAFGIIKEDQDEEDLKRTALQINLKEADEEMARHVEDGEQKQSQRNLAGASPNPGIPQNYPIDPWATRPAPVHSTSNGLSPPRIIHTPMNVASTPRGIESPRTAVVPTYASPTPSVMVKPYTPSPRRTPDTWQLLFPEPGSTNTKSAAGGVGSDGLVIKGILLVKSKSMVRKWKSKFCKLYRQRNHYQWDMEGKSYTLGYGVSKVEFNPNHPLSFIVYCNPFDDMAPVVYAAASTVDDYNHWMQALTQITSGRDYELQSLEGGARRPQAASQSTREHSDEASARSGMSAEEREAADLQRALLLSQTMN